MNPGIFYKSVFTFSIILFGFKPVSANEVDVVCLSNICAGDSIDKIINAKNWLEVNLYQGEEYEINIKWLQNRFHPEDFLKGPPDVVNALTHYIDINFDSGGKIYLDKTGLELLSEIKAVCYPVNFVASYESESGHRSGIEMAFIPSSIQGYNQELMVIEVYRVFEAKDENEARAYEAEILNEYPDITSVFDDDINKNWRYLSEGTRVELTGKDVSIYSPEYLKSNLSYSEFLANHPDCISKVSID